MVAVLELAHTLVDAIVVVVLPDSGMRYLSTSLYAPESFSI
jgi:cysteine synthase